MNIGAWGDSLTYGSGDTEALGWVGRLRKVLPTDDYHQLYNFGIGGETTSDLLKRFSIELQAIKPQKILLQIGINDSRFPAGSNANNVSIADFTANLELLITQAKEVTSDLTLIGLIKVDNQLRLGHGIRYLNEIEKYDAVINYVALAHYLPFVSMIDVIDPSTDLSDGLHPNTQGYQKMFERVEKTFHI